MKQKDIEELPVERIADKNCILFMWATFPKLQEALATIKAWGLDEKEVEESHDHSETFFKCKAYIKHGDIVLSGDERIFDYDFEQRKRTSVASRCPVQVVSDLKFTRNIIANLTQKSNLKRDRKGL